MSTIGGSTDLSLFVSAPRADAGRIELAVEGITCAACIEDIETALLRLPGVTLARLNYSTHRLVVEWQREAIDASAIVARLARLGYRAHPFVARQVGDAEAAEGQRLLKCLGVAGFAAMNVMLLSVSVWAGAISDITPETRDFFHGISALIALPAAAYAGRPFFDSAVRAVRARSLNMDVPITLGVVLALAMSVIETVNHAEHAYFDSAMMLLFFLLCGRYLDHAMRLRTRAVAANVAALKAETAHRLSDHGEVVAVPAEALMPGDRVLVRPGERLPADGVVRSGSADLDEGLITGETTWRRAAAGDAVFAGTLAHGGALTIEVRAAGSGTVVDEIQRLLDGAVGQRSGYVRLADRAARLYAPVVHAAAALTLAGWLVAGATLHDATIIAIAVLIITCPCALALAVPAVQVVAAGALFRRGILVGRGDALERLAECDMVVFDKTGTLTSPDMHLANAGDLDPDLIATAARLALSSRHPLAAAVAREAGRQEPFEGAIEEPGHGVRALIDGVEARLGSPTFVGVDTEGPGVGVDESSHSTILFRQGETIAVLRVAQVLRTDAASTVAALRDAGLQVAILSGDRRQAVEPIAARLGIADWRAGLKPADKLAALDAYRRGGHRVLMVGDGLNDAPALAAAHASLSPVTATAVTQAAADAVFLGERLAPVLGAITIGRQSSHLMRQNLWLAVLYNLVAVPLAIAGLVTPLIAAAAMSGSSILVTVNALRASVGPRATSRAEGEEAARPLEVPA